MTNPNIKLSIDEAIEYLTIINLQLDKFQYGIAIGKKRAATQLGIEALGLVQRSRKSKYFNTDLLPGEIEE